MRSPLLLQQQQQQIFKLCLATVDPGLVSLPTMDRLGQRLQRGATQHAGLVGSVTIHGAPRLTSLCLTIGPCHMMPQRALAGLQMPTYAQPCRCALHCAPASSVAAAADAALLPDSQQGCQINRADWSAEAQKAKASITLKHLRGRLATSCCPGPSMQDILLLLLLQWCFRRPHTLPCWLPLFGHACRPTATPEKLP